MTKRVSPKAAGSPASTHNQTALIQEVDPTKAWGLGTTPDGTPVRIPGTLSGEEITFGINHRGKDGVIYGRPEIIHTSSEDRVPIACSHFLTCGGCDYLHARLPLEHRLKRQRVAKALEVPEDTVSPVLASPETLHYRAVVKWVVGPNGELGSYAPRSHTVVDMQGCQIHAPILEYIGDGLRHKIRCGELSLEGIRYIVLRAALPHPMVHATLVVHRAGVQGETDLVRHLRTQPEVTEVWRHTNPEHTDAIYLSDGNFDCLYKNHAAVSRVGDTEQHLAAGAFVQVNPEAAAILYRTVAQLAQVAGVPVLDVYAGSGGISLTVAAAGAASVLGIERTPAAVQAARQAAMPYKGRVQFVEAAAEQLPKVLEATAVGPFPVWIMNPPRKGLAPSVIQALLQHRPPRVIYVSCHPDRLARDLRQLTSAYTINTIQPIDMFPKTRHVETIVQLAARPRD